MSKKGSDLLEQQNAQALEVEYEVKNVEAAPEAKPEPEIKEQLPAPMKTADLATKINLPGTKINSLEATKLQSFFKIFCQTEACPVAYRGKPDLAFAASIFGAALGMNAITCLGRIYVVNGCARLYGNAPLALVQRSGHLEYIKEWVDKIGTDDEVYFCETKRRNLTMPFVSSFSKAEAKQAALIPPKKKQIKDVGGKRIEELVDNPDSPWAKYYPDMMRYKARKRNFDVNFPDVIEGIDQGEFYFDEQMQEKVTVIPSEVQELKDKMKEIGNE
jgi:hypothetical protein